MEIGEIQRIPGVLYVVLLVLLVTSKACLLLGAFLESRPVEAARVEPVFEQLARHALPCARPW